MTTIATPPYGPCSGGNPVTVDTDDVTAAWMSDPAVSVDGWPVPSPTYVTDQELVIPAMPPHAPGLATILVSDTPIEIPEAPVLETVNSNSGSFGGIAPGWEGVAGRVTGSALPGATVRVNGLGRAVTGTADGAGHFDFSTGADLPGTFNVSVSTVGATASAPSNVIKLVVVPMVMLYPPTSFQDRAGVLLPNGDDYAPLNGSGVPSTVLMRYAGWNLAWGNGIVSGVVGSTITRDFVITAGGTVSWSLDIGGAPAFTFDTTAMNYTGDTGANPVRELTVTPSRGLLAIQWRHAFNYQTIAGFTGYQIEITDLTAGGTITVTASSLRALWQRTGIVDGHHYKVEVFTMQGAVKGAVATVADVIAGPQYTGRTWAAPYRYRRASPVMYVHT